jgi:hypothetical protein
MTLAAGGVDLPGRQKTAQNAFGVRLFMVLLWLEGNHGFVSAALRPEPGKHR